MTKLLLSLIFFFSFSIVVAAQINKGRSFLGADMAAAINSTKMNGEEVSKSNSFYFAPVFGKVIKENLLLGGTLGYRYQEDKSTNFLEANTASAGVFLRKYKNLGSSGFYVFAQGGLSGSLNNSEFTSVSVPDYETRTTAIGIDLYPGIAYSVSKRLYLDIGLNNLLMLNFHSTKVVETNGGISSEIKSKGFNFYSSLNNGENGLIKLGFRWFFGPVS